jgi:hypothetical protein
MYTQKPHEDSVMQRISFKPHRPAYYLLATTLTILSACGGSGDDTDPAPAADTDGFMNTLPSWSEFAPRQRPAENEGAEITDTSQSPLVEDIVDPDSNKTKVCTTEKISFYDTPDEYVMFTPPTDILYPGAMVQGKSLRDGSNAGELLPLIISQRNPVNVSIPACAIGNNFRQAQPTQSAVESAIAEILFEAQGLGVDCVNPQGTMKVETYRNEQQRALKAGMSGRYMGFSASASGSYSKSQTQNSVAMIFRETLYTVQIEAPQTPGKWFSDDFSADELQQQIDLGRMSKDNVPVYVATVTYGRILMSTMTSSASEKEMKAALQFKYNNPVGGVDVEAEKESQSIRQASTMTLAYTGGNAVATTAMLRSQDWSDYFSVHATAQDAVPISYVMKNISDNSTATVQELTEYDRVTCYDKLADDATFELKEKQTFNAGFSTTGSLVAVGDIDGKNGDDLIWASTTSRGELAIALANGDGSFDALIHTENPALNGISGDLYLRMLDVDNDGRDDIVLGILGPLAGSENHIFTSFYKGDASTAAFIHNNGQILHRGGGWKKFFPQVGQMDGKRGQDLIFNNRKYASSINRSYIAHAVDTTVEAFDLASDDLFVMTQPLDRKGDVRHFDFTHIADFNGDGRDDIMWQNIDSGNQYYFAYGTETGLDLGATNPDKAPYYQDYGGDWRVYTALAGDANGDGRADLVEPRQKVVFDNFGIYFGQGSDTGKSIIGSHLFELHNKESDGLAIRDLLSKDTLPIIPDMHLADVNGDGSQDLIINDLGRRNSLEGYIGVGLSIPGGAGFTFNRATQALPTGEDWVQYRLLVGDFNGDLNDDVVWIKSGSTHSVFVGIARSE